MREIGARLDLSTSVFMLILVVIAIFVVWCLRGRSQRFLLSRLYLELVLVYAVWAVVMICMRFAPQGRTDILWLLDAISYVGPMIPAIYLMIAISIVKNYEKMPRWFLCFLIVPVISIVIALTNPWHHLVYEHFSIIKSEIVFGPYVMVNGLYSYICFIASFVVMIRFTLRNPSRLYLKQCVFVVLGGLIPMMVSLVATFSSLNVPITATPLSFVPLILFNGVAIYRYRLLDIAPVATQHILDWISDCYLVLSERGLVISYNKPFAAVFASRYGITENRYLKDCLKEEDISKKTAIYNMITAVDTCRESQATISYEQAATLTKNGAIQKNYYVTDVSPLTVNGRPEGFIVIFKDITQLKKSMQQLQNSQNRMMEQERFAFLGQMIGGLAHNLKTPIMSISGCVSAADGLVDECLDSLGDPNVGEEDYREIYGEMRDWFQKIREASSYMSDIITAIKGQATNVSTYDESVFTLDELIKRTTLLMRHELVSAGCSLAAEYKSTQNLSLHGDINNLVQVLGNLVSNAIYAQKQVGGGVITVGIEPEGDAVKIYVKDTGSGIPPAVRKRLFKEMVTSKGAQGSGLGLYISNAVVHGKFKGAMWAEDNPGGGTIIGMTLPLHPNAEDTLDEAEKEAQI